MGGTSWHLNTNWMSGDPCTNSWYGVTCSGSGATKVSLYNKGLSGTLPTQLGLLGSLTQTFDYFSVGYDPISGTLPSELGLLSELTRMTAQYLELTGTIPTEVGRFTDVQRFYLHYNEMTGRVPRLDSADPCLSHSTHSFSRMCPQ